MAKYIPRVDDRVRWVTKGDPGKGVVALVTNRPAPGLATIWIVSDDNTVTVPTDELEKI